jgi:hypothetical protein
VHGLHCNETNGTKLFYCVVWRAILVYMSSFIMKKAESKVSAIWHEYMQSMLAAVAS